MFVPPLGCVRFALDTSNTPVGDRRLRAHLRARLGAGHPAASATARSGNGAKPRGQHGAGQGAASAQQGLDDDRHPDAARPGGTQRLEHRRVWPRRVRHQYELAARLRHQLRHRPATTGARPDRAARRAARGAPRRMREQGAAASWPKPSPTPAGSTTRPRPRPPCRHRPVHPNRMSRAGTSHLSWHTRHRVAQLWP